MGTAYRTMDIPQYGLCKLPDPIADVVEHYLFKRKHLKVAYLHILEEPVGVLCGNCYGKFNTKVMISNGTYLRDNLGVRPEEQPEAEPVEDRLDRLNQFLGNIGAGNAPQPNVDNQPAVANRGQAEQNQQAANNQIEENEGRRARPVQQRRPTPRVARVQNESPQLEEEASFRMEDYLAQRENSD